MEIDLIQVKGKKQPEAGVHRARPRRGGARIRAARNCASSTRRCSRLTASSNGTRRSRLIERCRKAANGIDVSGLYDMYVERIATYRAEPPPSGLGRRVRGGVEVTA